MNRRRIAGGIHRLAPVGHRPPVGGFGNHLPRFGNRHPHVGDQRLMEEAEKPVQVACPEFAGRRRQNAQPARRVRDQRTADRAGKVCGIGLPHPGGHRDAEPFRKGGRQKPGVARPVSRKGVVGGVKRNALPPEQCHGGTVREHRAVPHAAHQLAHKIFVLAVGRRNSAGRGLQLFFVQGRIGLAGFGHDSCPFLVSPARRSSAG